MSHRPSADRLLMPEPDNVSEVVRTREALEELVKSEGWRIFVTYTASQFQGRGYVTRMKGALGSTEPGLNAKVVDKTADEIVRLLQWPHDQVNELKGVVDE
jgi:hypothetical protein